MKAREIMTSAPEVVTLEDAISRAAEIMRDVDVGLVPVVDDATSMRLEGVITDRDIVVRHVAERHEQDCTVREHMTRGGLGTVRPDSALEEVTEIMRREQVRRVPVVDEQNRLVGIVSQADLAVDRASRDPEGVAETLEEISRPGQPSR